MDAELAAPVRQRRRRARAGRTRPSGWRSRCCPSRTGARSRRCGRCGAGGWSSRRRRHGLVAGAAAHRRARAALPRRGQLPRHAPAAAAARAIGEPASLADAHAPSSRRRSAPRSIGASRRCRSSSSPATTPHGQAGRRRAGRRAAAGSRCTRSRARTCPPSAHELEALATLWEREAALLERRAARRMRRCGADRRRAALRRARPRASSCSRRASRRRSPAARCGTGSTSPSRRSSSGCGSRRSGRSRRALGRRAGRRRRAVPPERARHRARRRASSRRSPAAGAVDGALWQRVPRPRARRGSTASRSASSPRAGWDDLVLPDAADGARCARSPPTCATGSTVYERWGFAAQERARPRHQRRCSPARAAPARRWPPRCSRTSCDLDLYRIDLSAVVSKYIGETEKNLRARLRRRRGQRRDPALRRGRRAVRQAQRGQGQPRPLRQHRGELPAAAHGGLPRARDPHDQPEGGARPGVPAPAALRRALPVPRRGRSARRSGAASFPPRRRRAGSTRAKLARLHVAGGSIRNIALNAAFLAAEAGEPVGMAHLLQAAHAEAAKRERPLTDAETRGWV